MIENKEDLPELPKSWSWICLDDVLLGIEAGKSFKAEGRPPSDEEVGVLKVSAVTWKIFNDAESKTCIVPEQIEPRFFVQPGDFLFSRANTIDLVGACVIVHKVSRRVMLSDKTLRFRFSDISPDWVLYMLRTRHGRNEIERLATGNQDSMRNIGQARIRRIRIPCPPLAEQYRIVNKIEELFTQLDAGVDLLKKLKLKLKRYRQAVLKAAVEGKLTQAWRAAHQDELEPASVLLGRILKERREKWEADQLAKMEAKGKVPKDDKWKLKYKEPAAPDTAELPELPKGWEWVSIGQTFEVYVGATPSRKREDYWNGETPWVSSGEVSFGRIKRTREKITKLGLINSSTNLHPPGTVLLGMIGEGKTRGQAAILDISACNSQNSAAIRVSEANLPPEYLFSFLEGEYERTRKIGSGNNQPALNKSRVQSICFPLPPISEQQEILERLSQVLSIEEKINSVLSLNLKRAERLRQSILKKAFEGKLVPQDPNDKPASLLLERIHAEKAQQAAEKKTTKPKQKKTSTKQTKKTKNSHGVAAHD